MENMARFLALPATAVKRNRTENMAQFAPDRARETHTICQQYHLATKREMQDMSALLHGDTSEKDTNQRRC